MLANLTPFPRDSSGLLVGRDRPWKESHRHYSHLLAIYPLSLITPDTRDGRSLIETSLRTWEGVPALFRGYSFTGGAAMHAMLGGGDSALARTNRFLDAPRYMEPNTLYAEAGPVIETPLAAATTMQELFFRIGAAPFVCSRRSRPHGATPRSTSSARTARFSSALFAEADARPG